MLIRIDPSSERAIYAQIADSVRASIAAGRGRPGETLPPARVLAQGLDVNQHTVLHAYQLLRDEGFVDLFGRYLALRHPVGKVRPGTKGSLRAAFGVPAALQQCLERPDV